jgi:hypothetical protein
LVPEITSEYWLEVSYVNISVAFRKSFSAKERPRGNSLWSFESSDIFVALFNEFLDDFLGNRLISTHSVSVVVLGQIIKSWVSRLSERRIHSFFYSLIDVSELD